MAPGPAVPKRKRGRPPTASNASQHRNEVPEEYEADAEEEPRPKKRGRPRKSVDSNPNESPADSTPQKIHQKSKPKTTDEPKQKRKRERASLEQETNETGLEADVENLALRTRDRNAAMKTKGQQLSKPRKRGRSSLQDLAPSDTNNKFTKPTKSDKAPRRQKPDEPTEETEETTNAPKGKKKRQTRLSLEDRIATLRRQSEVQKPTISANEQDDTEQAEGRKKRQRRSSQQEVLGAQLPLKSCLHVAPRVRGIKQSTIDAKWTPLGSPSIAIATETLELAHHPILQRMSNTTGRREHTSAALALLYKRITRKLHRGLPFPPAGMSSNRGDGGRETELDFESVLLGKQALEKQLDPALGAVEVLRREKQRVERELERDYKTLRNLEAGAKGQAREQRELLKKAHVLAPDAMASVKQDLELSFGNKGSVPPGALFKDIEDEEIKDLALQLGGHLDSMKTNLQQTEGLIPQLERSRAALRQVLLQHLDQGLYEKAVLG